MHYIGYTIGPIYETIFRTLNDTDKTRRLKAGSYFFSYFMKKLLEQIAEEFEILVPYAGRDALVGTDKIGFFHDRFIAISSWGRSETAERFDAALGRVYAALADETGRGCTAQGFADAMDNHLVIASGEELKQVDENAIAALNRILDSMELQRRVRLQREVNCIARYQDKSVEEKRGRVRTLEQIGHPMNYYAVITADGDRMGQQIRQIATNDPLRMRELSERLYAFFTRDEGVYGLTHDRFRGELIYAGGDDVLAFVPVKTDGESFLDYVRMLRERFERHMGPENTLSFGVNIVYYKYPLRDAIQGAFALLDSVKSAQGSNRVAIEVTKHSGQKMHTVHTMSDPAYRSYETLVKSLVAQEEMALPHAFHHTLTRYKDAIVTLYETPRTGASLSALFETLFNDERTREVRKGLDAARHYIELCAPRDSAAFDRLFSDLSIIKFLREDRA